MFHSDDNFSFGMPGFNIADGVGNLAEWITPVDGRCHFAGFHQLFQDNQILLVGLIKIFLIF